MDYQAIRKLFVEKVVLNFHGAVKPIASIQPEVEIQRQIFGDVYSKMPDNKFLTPSNDAGVYRAIHPLKF